MKTRLIDIICISLALLILLVACSTSPATSTPATTVSTSSQDGATLVQERCSVCHPLTFVERSRHTTAEWTTIVNMMISRGAQLTPQEAASAVDWLSANFGQ